MFFLCLVTFIVILSRVLVSVFHYRKISFESHLYWWFLFGLNFGVLAFALSIENSLSLKLYLTELAVITLFTMYMHKKEKASRSSIYRWIKIFRN